MNELTYVQRQELLDFFGCKLISHVRDVSLKISMDIANYTTVNPVKKEQYKALSNLDSAQKEAVCDLLSESITDTIYNFLDMFEANPNMMKLLIYKDGKEYDLNKLSEKMGSEISCMDEDGWIQKFSDIGRFVI